MTGHAEMLPAADTPRRAAPRPVTITVTDAHLAAGVRRSILRSPIALAVYETLATAVAVEDHRDHVTIYMPSGGPFPCPLPGQATYFAFGYDEGDRPGPVTFTLMVPCEVLA